MCGLRNFQNASRNVATLEVSPPPAAAAEAIAVTTDRPFLDWLPGLKWLATDGSEALGSAEPQKMAGCGER